MGRDHGLAVDAVETGEPHVVGYVVSRQIMSVSEGVHGSESSSRIRQLNWDSKRAERIIGDK
jgi:hypothetical protein